MIDLDVTIDDLLDAVLDAIKHNDEPAVRALTVAIAQADRDVAKRLVRSAEFRSYWEWRDWRKVIDA